MQNSCTSDPTLKAVAPYLVCLLGLTLLSMPSQKHLVLLGLITETSIFLALLSINLYIGVLPWLGVGGGAKKRFRDQEAGATISQSQSDPPLYHDLPCSQLGGPGSGAWVPESCPNVDL